MIICSRCKKINADGASFCGQCGFNLSLNSAFSEGETFGKTAEELNKHAVSTQKEPFNLIKFISDIPSHVLHFFKKIGQKILSVAKKIGKKRLIALFICLILLTAGTISAVKFVIPYAPHYFKGNSAFAAMQYDVAIQEYENAGNFFGAKEKLSNTHKAYADQLFEQGSYVSAAEHYAAVQNDASMEDKIIQCGDKLLDASSYRAAADVYETVNSNKADVQKNYANGMVSFGNHSYSEAKGYFKNAKNYKDAKDMLNACDLMIADEKCKDGEFTAAKKIYESLPEGFTYNGVSASDRLNLLSAAEPLINAMGTWTASDNYIETRNVWKRNGDWDSWYIDEVYTDQKLTLSCKMNSNNTFDVEGKVSFYKFDDYSSLSDYCKAKITSESFTIKNITALPASYQIDSYTTLTYSNGVFAVKYVERDNYSSYFYNVYTSSVTYGTR